MACKSWQLSCSVSHGQAAANTVELDHVAFSCRILKLPHFSAREARVVQGNTPPSPTMACLPTSISSAYTHLSVCCRKAAQQRQLHSRCPRQALKFSGAPQHCLQQRLWQLQQEEELAVGHGQAQQATGQQLQGSLWCLKVGIGCGKQYTAGSELDNSVCKLRQPCCTTGGSSGALQHWAF